MSSCIEPKAIPVPFSGFLSLVCGHSVGLLGRRIGPSQGFMLRTTTQRHKELINRAMLRVGLENRIAVFER